MNGHDSHIAEQLARVASRYQEQRTGHAPTAVTVDVLEDTIVFMLYDALTPAEKALAKTPAGAAKVQEFHRQLFASSMDEMRQEIKRITGRQVREAVAEIETATGTVVHAFTTGAMVQVFLLQGVLQDTSSDAESIDRASRADDDGLRVAPEAGFQDGSTPLTGL